MRANSSPEQAAERALQACPHSWLGGLQITCRAWLACLCSVAQGLNRVCRSTHQSVKAVVLFT